MFLVRRRAALTKRKRALAEENAVLRRRLGDGTRGVAAGLTWLGKAASAVSLALSELGQAGRRPAGQTVVESRERAPAERPRSALAEEVGEAAPRPCAPSSREDGPLAHE